MRRVLSIERLETLEQKKQLSPPSPKYPAPSTKKGRRSWRKVSNAERFTTAGSTSTWPKSGLIVASSVKFDVSSDLMSRPTRAVCLLPSLNGSPAAAAVLFDFAATYGKISRCCGVFGMRMPSRCPKRDGPPFSSLPQYDH